MFAEEVLSDPSIDWEKTDKKYNTVYQREHAIPNWLFQEIRGVL